MPVPATVTVKATLTPAATFVLHKFQVIPPPKKNKGETLKAALSYFRCCSEGAGTDSFQAEVGVGEGRRCATSYWHE